MTTLVIRVDDPPPGGGGYPVSAHVFEGHPPAAAEPVASGEIPRPQSGSPLGDRDLREWILSGGGTPDGTIGAVGRWLDTLIGAGDIGTCLSEHVDGYANGAGTEQQPRVVLDVRPEELRCLPWELLHRDSHRFIDRDRPWVRGRIDQATVHPDIAVPLRMMIVVADTTSRSLEWESEVSAIQVGVHRLHSRLHPEVLCDPSMRELFEELSLMRPHVLHVIGHGEVRPRDSMPQIQFRDGSTGDMWSLTRDHIANGMGPNAPRVVVLNACRTGDLATQGGTWSLVDTLLSRGVLAVVAMQADMPSEAAVTFASEFYQHIGDGLPIDVAANRGRRAVWLASPEGTEWALPSLTVSAPPDRVLPLQCSATDIDLAAIRRTTAHRNIESFVDRYRERRMWLSVDPDEETDRPARVLLVTGDPEVGKTDLVYSCLLTCFLRGRRLTYVDLDRQRQDWLEVLRRIRRGVPGLPIAPDLDRFDETAFEVWANDINYLARGQWAAPLIYGARQDEGARLQPNSEHADHQIDYAFALFRESLRRLAAEQPFILALDHVDDLDTGDFTRYLWPKLIQPVADGGVGHLRMIVVMRSERRAALVPEDADLANVREFAVPDFAPEMWPRLARELWARHGKMTRPHEDDLFIAHARALAVDERRWTPRDFDMLKQRLRRGA